MNSRMKLVENGKNIDFFYSDLIQTADVECNSKPIKIFSDIENQYIWVTQWVRMIWQLPFQFFHSRFAISFPGVFIRGQTFFNITFYRAKFYPSHVISLYYIFYWKYLLMW